MTFQPIILWTDALLYLLVVVAAGFVIWVWRDEHWRQFWQQVLQKRFALTALIILGIYIVIGLLDSIHFQVTSSAQNSDVQSVFDYLVQPLAQQAEKTYSAPLAAHLYTKEVINLATGEQTQTYPVLKYPQAHLLGTGKVGQDIFYECLKSIRTGLVIGTLTTLVMLPFAVGLGMLAGYFRGWIDDVVQYIYTTLSSVPDVLLIAAAVLSLQIFLMNHPGYFATIAQSADMRLLALCIILGVTSWTGLCRVLRGETLKLREMDYVQAAIALGTPNCKILTQHVLPNLAHLVLIAVVMDFSSLVLAEAVLTYVGVGVDPATISWGNMINAARLELARDPVVWWPLVSAFAFMFVLVLAANLLADAVREVLNPKL